jgi:hypothetical protein
LVGFAGAAGAFWSVELVVLVDWVVLCELWSGVVVDVLEVVDVWSVGFVLVLEVELVACANAIAAANVRTTSITVNFFIVQLLCKRPRFVAPGAFRCLFWRLEESY